MLFQQHAKLIGLTFVEENSMHRGLNRDAKFFRQLR